MCSLSSSRKKTSPSTRLLQPSTVNGSHCPTIIRTCHPQNSRPEGRNTIPLSLKRGFPRVSSIQVKGIPTVTTEQLIKANWAMIEDFEIDLVRMMEIAGRNLASLARYNSLTSASHRIFTPVPRRTWRSGTFLRQDHFPALCSLSPD